MHLIRVVFVCFVVWFRLLFSFDHIEVDLLIVASFIAFAVCVCQDKS